MSEFGRGAARGDDARFWVLADELAGAHQIVIDRPRGSQHARFPDSIYLSDYGYLEGATTVDSGGIDVWRGSLAEPLVTGMIATIDVVKGDAELKLLIGCTADEARLALAQHQSQDQSAILVLRP